MEKRLESEMKKEILNFPSQFEIGLKAAQGVSIPQHRLISPPNNIIVCGMGGSSLPAEILENLRPLNLFIHKSYGLPPQAGNGSLIICASYSGNTEETLSAFKEAIERKLPLLAITCGGKLESLARKNNIPLAILPPPYTQPRLALGMQFAALLKILVNHYLLPDSFLKEVIGLSKLKPVFFEKEGKSLANKISKKIPLIYLPEKLKGLGLIWKNNFNENAKTLAFFHTIPEMNHNEIVGFSNIGKKEIKNHIFPIILSKKDENPRILKRIKIIKEILKKEGILYSSIDIPGNNVLEVIFNGSLLGLWASYYLALEYGVDPIQVKIIEEIKNKLKR